VAMTENDWSDSAEPRAMLDFLESRASYRKMRLLIEAAGWAPEGAWESAHSKPARFIARAIVRTAYRDVPPGEFVHARKACADLLREIFGPLPFRPVTIRPGVLAWNDGLVVRLAEAIYDEGQWGDMPILGDALLDAGCGNQEVLEHVQSPGHHVRGCWVIDLILGRE
jgi:hypothetical protein